MVKPNFKDNTAETLLIPLWMRVKESRRVDAIHFDLYSCNLVRKIDYDFSKFDNDCHSQIGVALRTKFLDDVTWRFVNTHDNPVVVIIGCGLDPRFQRLGKKEPFMCYELDLPEVIDFRRTLIPETEYDRYISASALDTSWMDEIKWNEPNANFLFIIEGVLMYFEEEQVKGLIKEIGKRFPSSQLYFERMGKNMSHKTNKHTAVKKTKANMKWGENDAHTIEKWSPNMHLIDEYYYMADPKNRTKTSFLFRHFNYFKKMFGIWGYSIA